MESLRQRYPRLVDFLERRGGIAHRAQILRDHVPLAHLRAFMREQQVQVIRRAWIALPAVGAELIVAAQSGGRLSCVTFARHRRWWMPESAPTPTHLHLHPRAGSARRPADWDGMVHWSAPIGAFEALSLYGTVEDALAHIARCLPLDDALAVWESAMRVEKMSIDTVRRIAWRTTRARKVADAVVGLNDSGLETILGLPLSRWGLRVRHQVRLCGAPVDLLVGDLLVIQTDGWAFHSSSAQRSRDIAHDAALRLRGYTVLRFSYSQVVRDLPGVLATIRQAVAQGLHLAA